VTEAFGLTRIVLMTKILSFLFEQSRILFALAFLTPLFAQIMAYFEVVPPFGMSHLLAGLAIALPYGVIAKFRGRWI